MPLYVKEVYINKTRGWRFGDSGPDLIETYTDNIGELFRSMQQEYGRCVSGVYVDKKDGGVQKIGWVFEKRMRYEDARPSYNGRYSEDDHYLREVWVEVHTALPDKSITYHHANL